MQGISNEQLFEKLAKVEALLEQAKFANVDEKSMALWELEDIAKYMGFTYRHVQNMVNDVYFPKAVRLPSQRDCNKPSNKLRWFAGEVVRYARRKQMS